MPVTPVTLDAPQAQAGSEHGYCGDMAEMTFIKPFLFTHPDHTREQFAARTCRVPVEVATHWFALAHTDTPLPNVPAPGTPAFAEARRAELMSSTARLFEQQQHDMMAASQVNRKAIEETVRIEAKGIALGAHANPGGAGGIFPLALPLHFAGHLPLAGLMSSVVSAVTPPLITNGT